MRLILPFLLLAACGRPSEEDCRRALLNVQKIAGLSESANAPDPEPEIRKCKSNGTKEQVDCLIAARNEKDLAACKGK